MTVPAKKGEKPHDCKPLWREAELGVADAMGRLMEFWGFRRHLGRIWTVLYLSPEPLSTHELAEVLQLSPSTVSLCLAELIQWGAVRKTWKPGQRRDHFEAESSIWKLLRRVYERRELRLIRETQETFREAERRLREAGPHLGLAERARVEYMVRRLSRLSALSRAGERLVRALVAGRAVNPSMLRVVEGQGT